MSLKYDFIQLFHALIPVYRPGAGADNPYGTNIDVNRTALSLYPFAATFKEIPLSLILYIFFHDLIQADSPQRTKF